MTSFENPIHNRPARSLCVAPTLPRRRCPCGQGTAIFWNNWKVGEYTVEHLALETRTVNESRKVCNLYGPGPQCLPCIHEQIGLPACLCPPNPFKLT
jgi:hypothetical protein